MNDIIRPKPIPLPATVGDLLSQRRTIAGRTLNDYVEDLHVKLWEKPAYKALFDAVYDEDAVEGSTECDDNSAAEMIRAEANKDTAFVPQVANKKRATIIKSLHVVMRRYHISRKQRARTLGGEIVPDDNGS